MKSKLFMFVLFFALTSAHAVEPVAFSYDYTLYDAKNGQFIGKGYFAVRVGHPTKLDLDTNGKLSAIQANVSSEYVPAQDGGEIIYDLHVEPTGKLKKFYLRQDNNEYRFGNPDVMVIVSAGKPYSYYYMNADGKIMLSGKSDHSDIYVDILSKNGSCIGGALEEAANDLLPRWYLPIEKDTLSVIDGSLNWTVVKRKCLEHVENSDIPPGTSCLQWEEISRKNYTVPQCTD